jgi:hypothetical protein
MDPTKFHGGPRTVRDPARDAKAVTPSNTANLPDGVCAGLWVGGLGNVRVLTREGTDVTFTAVAAGTHLPVQVQRVFATSTTASLILALY